MARKKKQTREQVAAARRRQTQRSTKPPGLIRREEELVASRRELRTIQGTGVATGIQLRRAQNAVTSAEKALKRQHDAAKRAGRLGG